MESVQNRPHYTYEDYRHWEGKWELLHGQAVAMSPAPGLPHARFSSRILHALLDQFDENDACGDCDALAEIEWVLEEDVILRPDISMLCSGADTTRIYAAPIAIIEILSPKTHLRDRNEKRDLYRDHGVKRYLLADPKTMTLHDVEASEQPEIHRLDLHAGCTVELPSQWTTRR